MESQWPVACNYALLSRNHGLLCGIVACYFGLFGFQVSIIGLQIQKLHYVRPGQSPAMSSFLSPISNGTTSAFDKWSERS